MRCILHGNYKLAEALVKKGANPNHLNGENLTTLMVAIKSENEEAVKYLLNRNINVHFKDPKGRDACDYALISPIFDKW